MSIVRWILGSLAVCGLAFGCIWYWGRCTTVIDDGMEPTIQSGEIAVINHIIYNVREPKRGDIIAYETEENQQFYSISRVVALPGETVQIENNILLIDGKAIGDSFIDTYIEGAGIAQSEMKLDENEYFVLGDNSSVSVDSRMAEVGLIHTKEIKGKVWVTFTDFTDINLNY